VSRTGRSCVKKKHQGGQGWQVCVCTSFRLFSVCKVGATIPHVLAPHGASCSAPKQLTTTWFRLFVAVGGSVAGRGVVSQLWTANPGATPKYPDPGQRRNDLSEFHGAWIWSGAGLILRPCLARRRVHGVHRRVLANQNAQLQSPANYPDHICRSRTDWMLRQQAPTMGTNFRLELLLTGVFSVRVPSSKYNLRWVPAAKCSATRKCRYSKVSNVEHGGLRFGMWGPLLVNMLPADTSGIAYCKAD